MRKLKLQVQTTVDGFIGGPNGEMDWMELNWDHQLKNYVNEITDPVDSIVLGRKLAEGFIPYWEAVAADPKNPEVDAGKKYSQTPKVVFTRSLQTSQWDNTVLAKGDVVEEINKLKRQNGRDIIAYGGATFVSMLIRNGLIDEYHLFVNPTAIGKGLPIFQSLQETRQLHLSHTIPFDCGIVLLRYVPKKR